ncbi:hypothetical protein BJV78DRAFT_62043 [Lactifluus subvellereus]|nr:hypothetical protein BJV78DRAFT_62043 [Lactifluus subvellereus]
MHLPLANPPSTSVPHSDPEPDAARFPPTPTLYVPRRKRHTIDAAAAMTYASRAALATSRPHPSASSPLGSQTHHRSPGANASPSPTRTMMAPSMPTVTRISTPARHHAWNHHPQGRHCCPSRAAPRGCLRYRCPVQSVSEQWGRGRG